MKILFLLDKLTAAGTQTNLLELVKRLDRTRFEPSVVALLGGGELSQAFRESGAAVIELDVKKAYDLSGIKALLFLIGFMKRQKIDIVQTHFLHADILGTVAAKIAGVKKIITARRDEGFWRSGRQLFLNCFLNRFADTILVNSSAVWSAVVRDERAPSQKIHRIHNGVDPNQYYPSPELRNRVRRELEIQDSERVVGLVANMRHAVKGHIYLMDAVPSVLKKIPNAKFLFVGEGPLQGALHERAAKLGVRRHVLFLGVRRDINALMNAMDVYCLPSLSEGFSNSILEAMAVGKPVVATDAGGNPELVDEGKTGFLVPARSSEALADKLKELLRDETLRTAMGRSARERILVEFAMKKMVEQYEAFYSQLLAPRPLKIMFVIGSLDLGGAERVVIDLARHLDRSLFEPRVCCLNEKGRYAPEVEKAGIRVFALRKKGKVDPFFLLRFVRLIQKEKPDLIHTHLFTANLWGRLAARITGVPALSTEHNVDLWKRELHFTLDRWLLPVTERLISVSKKVEEFYRDKLPSLDGKARVIYNGIDTTQFAWEEGGAIRRRLGIPPSAKVVGIVGRLVPQKAPLDFIEAVGLLVRERKEIMGLVVGEGELRPTLEKKVRELGLEGHVVFTGFRNDLPKLYRAMDVFVLSSLREGLPIAILEAMASGVPVVATDVGGVSELIENGTDGFLVAAGDAAGLRDSIARVLDDNRLRETIVSRAREKVRLSFDVGRMARDHEILYQEVLAG